MQIDLPAPVRYVGSDRWVLYGVADCELHVFVEADERRRVERLYWIQFEGYLPTQPELRYSPAAAQTTTTLAGLDFFVRARFGATTEPPRAGSDAEHVNALLKSKGYTLPPEMMNARFIHYVDERLRQELMIIYSEDLSATGFSTAQLSDGGDAHGRWGALSESLVQRARNRISLQRIGTP